MATRGELTGGSGESRGDLWAIVPARAGSRGVPSKNLAQVGGATLLARAIDAAREARSVDRVIVSTDSPAIADAARKCGAEVPFMRPEALARDDTPGIEPIRHALRWLQEAEGRAPTWVVCLQPTSPFRRWDDVDAAFRLARETRADAVISVAPATAHPQWVKRIDDEGCLRPFLTDTPVPLRRQDLPAAYALNGAIYLAKTEVLEAGSFYGKRTVPYVMPLERALDVDSPWDLRVARAVAQMEGR